MYLFQQSLQQANPIHQHSNIHSSDLNLGSQYVSQTDNYNGKIHQLPNCHVKICNCMHLHSQRNPLYELSILSPSDQTSTGQNQLYPPGELFGAAHYAAGIVVSPNNKSRLIAATKKSMLIKGEEEDPNNARFWMRFDR